MVNDVVRTNWIVSVYYDLMDTDKARTNSLSFAINYPVVAFGDGHHIILTVAENMREGSVWSHSRYVGCGICIRPVPLYSACGKQVMASLMDETQVFETYNQACETR